MRYWRFASLAAAALIGFGWVVPSQVVAAQPAQSAAAMSAARPAQSAAAMSAAQTADPAQTEPMAAQPCELGSGTVTSHMYAGKPRTFTLVVPPGATSASPLFVSLHGATGSATGQARTLGLPAGAGIALFPQATGSPPGTFWDAMPGSDDVRFVAELVSQVHQYGCGSPATTSASGFSLGAMMVARLLCHSPDLFTSAVMVAGALPPTAGCRVSPRTSVLVVHGTADLDVPFDGTLSFWLSVFAGGPEVSVFPGVDRANMAAMWQSAKGCEPATRRSVSGALVAYDMTSCGTAPTRAVVAAGGGHSWDLPGDPGLTTARLRGILPDRGVPGRVVAPAAPARIKLADGPASVLVNVTVTAAGARGYTVLYPCDTAVPLASVNSFTAGETVPTMAVVQTGDSGEVCVHVSTPTHVVLDVYGAGDAITSHPPVRLADSRASDSATAGRPVAAGAVLRVPARVAAGTTVFANVTVTGAAANGYTTVFPCDQPRPTASTNNFFPGRSSAGFASVGTDAAGDFCVYTSTEAHLIVDAYASAAPIAARAPVRLADTRFGDSVTGGQRLPAGAVLSVATGAEPGSTVFANVTVTGPTSHGYTTVFPCDAARPVTSTGNFSPGRTAGNAAAVRVDARGNVCVYTSATAHLVVDAYAVTDAVPVGAPRRVFDSRQPW